MLTTCSVSVSILGFLLGPVYPCAATVFTRLIPANMQVFAIGFISSMGSSGGAVVPFLTGLIAQSSGTWVLHPICKSLCVSLRIQILTGRFHNRHCVLCVDDLMLAVSAQEEQASRVAMSMQEWHWLEDRDRDMQHFTQSVHEFTLRYGSPGPSPYEVPYFNVSVV